MTDNYPEGVGLGGRVVKHTVQDGENPAGPAATPKPADETPWAPHSRMDRTLRPGWDKPGDTWRA